MINNKKIPRTKRKTNPLLNNKKESKKVVKIKRKNQMKM